ncbi:unnamed protein product [Meloidogyne enterolobii]|uniref:Uncharacterized protein n=1 Tax=Meloidogyne enterolobii TaxID=390850 RepID=A0ACB1BBB1_MELEN
MYLFVSIYLQTDFLVENVRLGSSSFFDSHKLSKSKIPRKVHLLLGQIFSSKNEIQKGIEKAKNRLKSSLNEAIDSGRSSEYSQAIRLRQEKQDASEILDSVSRHAAIERIEEPGFNPCSFKSDADSARMSSTTTKSSENTTNLFTSSSTTHHDRAMFGPLWASKQIAEKSKNKKEVGKKRDKDENKEENKKEETTTVPPASRFPLAHEKLSEDPEVRNKRWLELFRERRRMTIEGIL